VIGGWVKGHRKRFDNPLFSKPYCRGYAWDWLCAMAAARAAPRCTAMSKRSRRPCQAPAVRGWTVCRMHGARGGGQKGERNGAYVHGERTRNADANRAAVRALIKSARRLMRGL
jgi:hypothetical protein